MTRSPWTTEELETCTTNALILAARRNALSYHVPDCPQCGASRHGYMQLTDWLRVPAEWKCRQCGYRFLHEPVVSNAQVQAGPAGFMAGIAPATDS